MDKVDNIVIIMGLDRDSNCYIFDDVIVDPGTGFNMDYFESELNKAELKLGEDLTKIVATHCHYDHIGACEYLQKEYGMDVYMHELDSIFVEEKNRPATVSTSFNCEVPDIKINKIVDGDTFGDFKVIHTPGHTQGGICLFDGTSLISGDTLFSGGSFGRSDLPSGDIKQLKKSIDKLANLDITKLFPGHDQYAISSVQEQILMSQTIITQMANGFF